MLVSFVVERGEMREPFFPFVYVDGLVYFVVELRIEGICGISGAEDVALGY